MLTVKEASQYLSELSNTPVISGERFRHLITVHKIKASQDPKTKRWKIERAEVERFARENYRPDKRPGRARSRSTSTRESRYLIARTVNQSKWMIVSNPNWDDSHEEQLASRMLHNLACCYVEYKNCGVVYRVVRDIEGYEIAEEKKS